MSRKGSEGPEGPAGTGRHLCSDCGLSFESGPQLGAHRVGHRRPGGGERFRCRTCGKGFETLHALGGHQKTHQPAQRARLPRDDQDTEARVRPDSGTGKTAVSGAIAPHVLSSVAGVRWHHS